MGMKHANEAANQVEQRRGSESYGSEAASHGSAANQAKWQAIRAARRQGNVPDSQRIARFGGDNAFGTVAENRLTYGKPESHPKGPSVHVNGYGTACTSERIGKDKRESGKHIFAYIPKAASNGYPAARLPLKVVAVSQGSRVAKRFRVDSIDRVTGEDTSILVTLVTNEIHVLCYGKHFVFSKTNRSKATYCDSRDGKRYPLYVAKAELCRMLGVTEGMAKYAELVALPPKRPATGSTQQGSKATLPEAARFDGQGIRVA